MEDEHNVGGRASIVSLRNIFGVVTSLFKEEVVVVPPPLASPSSNALLTIVEPLSLVWIATTPACYFPLFPQLFPPIANDAKVVKIICYNA